MKTLAKKKFKKLVKKYKKILVDDAKCARPYDYGFGTQFFYDFLCYMRDFYELNELVQGEEREECNRLETIKEAIREYDLYRDADGEIREHFWVVNKDYIFPELFNKDVIEVSDPILPVSPYKTAVEASKAYEEERESHYNRFFEIVQKYLRYWWD